MICIGLVITFVGLGDKGFKTLELKLIGPSLVGCGVFFALLRILFCTLPSCCKKCLKCCRKEKDDKEGLMNEPPPHSAINGDHMVSLYVYHFKYIILYILKAHLVIIYDDFLSRPIIRKSYPESIYQICLLSITTILTVG